MRSFTATILMATYSAVSGAKSPAALPVTDVNCAAIYTMPALDRAASPNFETMREYFYAQAVAHHYQDKADTKINDARTRLMDLTPKQREEQARACGYKFLDVNPRFSPLQL